jgi:6-phosphogluconate dehydrogenase
MANQNKTDIGLIGLAVMGENLALNMESKGWHVSVYNRTVPGVEEGVVDRFMNGRAKGKNIEGFTDIKAFVESIATPRKIMMMVRAGSPVDELMDQLFPLLSPGDILIDGGNSNYEDTNRRVKIAESKGFLFVGSGVSGGEEGALNGASIMPGGSAGSEACLAEHRGESAGRNSLLPVGRSCRIGTFCEDDSQRYRIR